MKYRTIDLCAGIGGIRRGFELTGKFKNVLSAEVDELACQTYQHMFKDNPRNDLTSAAFKEKLSCLKYDALLAGFPCQTFSSVGLRQGFKDQTKGTIFFDIAEIIQKTQPKFVFLENVENLVHHDKGNTFRIIIETLEIDLGYKVIGVDWDLFGHPSYNPSDFIRNSRDYGIPQNRPRVYIIAFSKRYFGNHLDLLPTSIPTHREGKPIYKDVRDVLEKGVVPVKYFVSSGYLETLEKHLVRQQNKGYGFGMKVVNDPSIEHPVASTLLATGGSGRERNLIIDQYNGERYAGIEVKGKYSPINTKNIRTMMPNEWGRLQGFVNYAFLNDDGEDEFSFPDGIPDVQKYKQFGNSVTIPVIETMAKFILECIEKMIAEFTPIEKRLYTMWGKDFLMCSELYSKLKNRIQNKTFLEYVDIYYHFGLENEFHNKDVADFAGMTSARVSQAMNQLISIGFAKRLKRGTYCFTESFIDNIWGNDVELN